MGDQQDSHRTARTIYSSHLKPLHDEERATPGVPQGPFCETNNLRKGFQLVQCNQIPADAH